MTRPTLRGSHGWGGRFGAVALALALAISVSSDALAVSASISPSTQSHSHGVASTWHLSWGGTGPFSVYFWWDINDVGADWALVNTSTTSKQLSHAFYPCTGTTFKQELDNYDQLGFAATTSHATEAGGNPC